MGVLSRDELMTEGKSDFEGSRRTPYLDPPPPSPAFAGLTSGQEGEVRPEAEKVLCHSSFAFHT